MSSPFQRVSYFKISFGAFCGLLPFVVTSS